MTKQTDSSELVSWVTLYTKELLSWAYHKTSNLQTAEDLVQDTFVVAAEKFSSFRNESQPKTWLFGILNNKIAEHFKNRAKQKTFNLDDRSMDEFFNEHGHWKGEFAPREWDADPGHLLDDEEFNRTLQECLDRLPSQWHACLSLKYIEGEHPKKVCQELAITATNYWQIVHRAKLHVRRCLEIHWFNE